jgi:hypothetical protein
VRWSRAAGAARTRHSLRPLIGEGGARFQLMHVSSPPSTRPCAWRGGVGGGGSISLLLCSEFAEAPPTPDLESELCSPRTPPLRGGRSGDGGLFEIEVGVYASTLVAQAEPVIGLAKRDPVAGYDIEKLRDVIARSEATKQSILSLLGMMDCFAEPVIGRAFARPVGSQ